MAVFYDTGNGDIYGGPDKASIIAAMYADAGDDFDEDDIFEVPGTQEMRVGGETEEVTEEVTTLEDEYNERLGAYCVASENY